MPQTRNLDQQLVKSWQNGAHRRMANSPVSNPHLRLVQSRRKAVKAPQNPQPQRAPRSNDQTLLLPEISLALGAMKPQPRVISGHTMISHDLSGCFYRDKPFEPVL